MTVLSEAHLGNFELENNTHKPLEAWGGSGCTMYMHPRQGSHQKQAKIILMLHLKLSLNWTVFVASEGHLGCFEHLTDTYDQVVP